MGKRSRQRREKHERRIQTQQPVGFEERQVRFRPMPPDEITPQILEFCQSIVQAAAPVYVPVKRESYAVHGYCHHNVNAKVSVQGGELVHGRIIWEAKGYFLEAECHCVWRSPDSDLFD